MSGLFLWLVTRNQEGAPVEPAAPAQAEGKPRENIPLYACILIIYLLSCVPIGIAQLGSADYTPSWMTFVRDTINILVMGCLLAVAAVAKNLDKVPLPCLVLLSTLVLVGVTVCSALQPTNWLGVGVGITATGSSCLSILLFGNRLPQRHQMAHIGDVMCLSLSTVQTHAKAIYRKLGVHSKQEAIDLIHGRQSD